MRTLPRIADVARRALAFCVLMCLPFVIGCGSSPPATYNVGGNVSGLKGSGLVLQDNGGDNLAVQSNGSFAFTTPLATGAAYAVTVLTQPSNPSQTCMVTSSGRTVASSNVTNVSVVCTTNTYAIGGVVSGLAGLGLSLQDDGVDGLSVTANGNFTFATSIASGDTYNVAIGSQPSSPAQSCAVTNGSGMIGGSNVTTVEVICQAPKAPDGNTLLLTYATPQGTAYDRVHKHLFVTVTNLNRVDVFSTVDYHLVASIPVPMPLGIDIAPDDTRVVVGSATQEFFFIDTGLLQVVQQVPLAALGTGNVLGAQPSDVALTSTGNTLLLTFPPGGGSAIGSLEEWNPSTGQFTQPLGPQVAPMCMASSADHRKTLIGTCGLNNANPQVALYDAATDSIQGYLYGGSRVEGLAANPNGTQFAVNVFGTELVVLDENFNVVGTVGLSGRVGNMVYSLDGRYLYLAPNIGGSEITVLETTNFTTVALVPEDQPPLTAYLPTFVQPSVDENGVLFDVEYNSIGATPTLTASGSSGDPTYISVAPPSGALTGATAFRVDGAAPQLGFMVRNAAPPSGGSQLEIYDYGLQYSNAIIQVTIGGSQGTVTGNADYSSDLPGIIKGLTVQTPPGQPGPQDVTISTPSGTTTIKGAFDYLGGAQVIPVSGSLWQIALDQNRQRLYATNTTDNRVEVYSLASGQFLPPIPVGAAPHGISLTPSGSQLVVANSGDGTVTILDPDAPANSSVVPVVIGGQVNLGLEPSEVATTSDGKALVMLTLGQGSSGYGDALVLVDLSTHAVTSGPGRNLYLTPSVLAASKDGSSILCACGSLGLWSSQTGTFSFGGAAEFEAAISGDGNIFATSGSILNSQLLQYGALARWSFLPPPFGLSGTSEVLNASGSLLFQVDNSGSGAQLYDVNHGDVEEWTPLPEQVAPRLHMLTIDDERHNLYVLSESGFTILNFSFIPLSIGYIQPNQGAASGGTVVTIRGSGFQPDSQVSFGGLSATTTFVDSQTLTAVTPTLLVGPKQVTITNTDGQSYSLDNSFTAQ
jgi:DNA-binding beta-propeller fold protein YncE